MAFTTSTANKILDALLRNVALTPPASVFISLHTADPAQTGVSEATGGSYSRKAIAFAVASAKTTSNTGVIEFAGMPTATITHVGLWDASTAGNFWWGGALSSSKAVTAGDTFRIAIGDFDVTLV